MNNYDCECIFYLGLQVQKTLEEKNKVWLYIDNYYDSINIIYEDYKKYDNTNKSLLDSINDYIDNNINFILETLKGSYEIYKSNNKLNNLELAMIEEIDMILDCNFDNEIELSENTKLKIAREIICKEDRLWEDLNNIIRDKIEECEE